MPLPKILAPLLPQSQRLQQKQHDAVLSPALPMSPPTNNPYNNMIGLSTEETLVESVDESTTETAIVLHEKPTAFDMCDNDLLIESCHDNNDDSQQLEQKELISMSAPAETTAMSTNTTYQSFGSSSSSLTMSLTDSGNETLTEITPDEELEEPVKMPSSPLECTTPVTPPQLMEEEQAFIDTMDHHQQLDLVNSPLQVPAVSDQQPDDMEEVITYSEEPMEVYHDPFTAVDVMDNQMEERIQAQDDFTQPIQASYTTHQGELLDEAQEPDFMMKNSFRRAPSREGSLKSKCMKLIRGMKFRLSQERKETKKENRMKAAFEASADQEGHIDTHLARSCSTVTILNEERLTPIYRRNIAESTLCSPTNTEPIAPYKSPEIGSDAYDIKLLCDQSFFGRY
ncbi:Vacuolar protein sorting-associated protein 70 [Mucor velutinosus]|uniref:Vacuolar protein sorting-associated protein 70 n=1 Tax=Mucor velutinosus TaxID=708070 RepID=A0AAN7DM40_9FUNG|nr:Vacuolar protein sorting-associated protein 70 [Mucor velutinosus]